MSKRRTFSEYVKAWEDAAANAVGHGGVSLPADAMPKHAKQKKLSKKYDGRTKEGRKFIERILLKRAAREANKKDI